MAEAAPLILISDDDPVLRAILGDQFQAAGFRVLEDGQAEVVKVASEARPDLILLDVVQKVEGLKLLTSLKEHPATRQVPVVMITAWPDEGQMRFCLKAGATSYTRKPLSEGDVMRFARMAVESHRRRACREGTRLERLSCA
ncbi:MAG: response regulator [Myxococcales bacterium]|nr:response regulator [Myxococcales bacterium]